MTAIGPKRKRGPKPKPKTATEARLQELESNTSAARRRISGKDRFFIQLFADRDFKDANGAATAAGFKEPFAGERLVQRLAYLIEAERMRRVMGQQMEVDEALIHLAALGRGAERHADRIAALRTILQVQGALADRPLAASDRRSLTRQAAEIVDRVKRAMAGKPAAERRVRAMLVERADGSVAAAVESVSGPETPSVTAPALREPQA